MKKLITRTLEEEKVFLKYTHLDNGYLLVQYYMPKSKSFSIIWESQFHRTLRVMETRDGRNTIMEMIIHPTFWAGNSVWENCMPIPISLDDFTKRYIKLL